MCRKARLGNFKLFDIIPSKAVNRGTIFSKDTDRRVYVLGEKL